MATTSFEATLASGDHSPSSPESEIPRARMGSDPEIPLQSGIPPARLSEPHTPYARGEAHAQAALAASVRTEASLGGLFRTVQHLSATVNAARDANDQLVRELEHVRELLAHGDQEQLSLKRQVAALEQSVARSEREAERERSFLIDQQDTFIVRLCVDHEREMATLEHQVLELREALRVRRAEETAAQSAGRATDLAQRLDRAEQRLTEVGGERDAMRQQLAQLQAQRLEAEAALVRIASERDQAMIELSRVRSNGSPRSSARAEAPRPISELVLDPFPRAPALPSAVDTPLYAFEEVTPTRPLPARNPPGNLKQKPDPSTRPLIGYSFAGEALEEEHLEGSRISTRPKSR